MVLFGLGSADSFEHGVVILVGLREPFSFELRELLEGGIELVEGVVGEYLEG